MKTPTRYAWQRAFLDLLEIATARHQAGERNPKRLFTPAQTRWLASIGATPREVFDFAEDRDDIDPATALLITAARRDFFLVIQKGRRPAAPLDPADFPAREAKLAGIPWLPRIIAKARAKLRGTLPDDLMFCCGGDRAFLQQFDIHPADFLRVVWAARADDRKIASYVKARAKR